jgi:hypothetical protein
MAAPRNKGLPRSLKNSSSKLPAATATTAGVVKKGATVANATDAASAITQLNALIASLKASGALA